MPLGARPPALLTPISVGRTADNAAPVLYSIVLTVKEGPYQDGKFTLVQTKVKTNTTNKASSLKAF